MSRTFLALACTAAALLATSARPAPSKKLIEWGWGEPDTAFLRARVAEVERAPFDGCVYHAMAGRVNFTWKAWGRRAFRAEELEQAMRDLRATRFVRFRSNFLRLNVTPADLDWFDDHGAVVANARLAARVARAGRSAGVVLDTEQYEQKLFDYRRQRETGGRSFAAYAAQVRLRGREVMEAFEQGYPGLTVLLSLGHSAAFWPEPGGHQPLATVYYGLLPAFVDGLIDGARAGRIVDGFEPSYAYKQPERFRDGYRTMSEGVLPIVADPDRYRRVMSFGFGIWMDYEWRRHGWNVFDFSKNHFTPAELQTAVRAALQTADEYVWIYSEQPRWWSPEGGPLRLPAAYDDALRRAKRDGAGPARIPR